MEYKFYSREIILNNVEKNKGNIDYVECFIAGYEEDTKCIIYDNNNYTIDVNMEQDVISDTFKIEGLRGSYKSDPMIKIVFKDGSDCSYPCYKIKKQLDITSELKDFIDSLKDHGILKLELKANYKVVDEVVSIMDLISRLR